MPRLSGYEISGAIGMLKAGVRVSGAARYHYCHPSTIQRRRDRYHATGTVKNRRSLVSQEWRPSLRGNCIDDIYIDDIRSGRLLSLPDK